MLLHKSNNIYYYFGPVNYTLALVLCLNSQEHDAVIEERGVNDA